LLNKYLSGVEDKVDSTLIMYLYPITEDRRKEKFMMPWNKALRKKIKGRMNLQRKDRVVFLILIRS